VKPNPPRLKATKKEGLNQILPDHPEPRHRKLASDASYWV
jgi:hypothetical protein